VIRDVRVFRQEQPFADGPYSCSGGSAESFDSTIVALADDDGHVGWGETAPLGAFYDPAFAAGARAAIAELAPLVAGQAADRPASLERRLAAAIKGHPYARAAIVNAACDLAARRAEVPLCDWLGGRDGETVDLYRSLVSDAPRQMAARAVELIGRGYRRLQVKIGGDPVADAAALAAVRDAAGASVPLFADANGSYDRAAARRFLAAARGIDFWLEQPCATYAECRDLRGICDVPLVLDESIDSVPALVRAASDGVADAVTIKLARVGGLLEAARIRDVAVALGIAVTIEDTGGSDIATATMVHASLSTPAARRLHTVDFNAWVTVANADGMPSPHAGRIGVPDGPGLGLEVREAVLAGVS
jgi:cis-L-3-hydroxyproline dehydratase